MTSSKITTARPTASTETGSMTVPTSGTSTSTPSAGKPPATPGALQGLQARAKRTLFGREVAFNALVPGLGGTVERPVRPSPEPSSAAAPTDDASRLSALSTQAQGLRDRLPPSTPAPWDRPARTPLNRLATAVVPWLKPRPLAEKATTHSGTSQPGTPAPPLGSGGLQVLSAEVQSRQQQADKDRFVRQRLQDTKSELYAVRAAAIEQIRQVRQAEHPSAALKADASAARERLKVTDTGVSAVLQASLTLAKAAEAPDPAVARAVFEAREAQALQVQATRPRGFPDGAASARFGARLLAAVSGRPANPAADALPSIGVMEIASDLMSVVCQGDAARAHRLLEALQSRPARDWMQGVADLPAPGTDAVSDGASAAAEADVRNLLRQACVLPRGAEVAHLLGDPDDRMPDSETLQAMRAFWSADAAQRAETDPAVRQWLAGAKRVARQPPAEAGGPPSAPAASFSGAERAAYHAVRNGCVSNAAGSPHARHDDRMKKAIDAWLTREQPSLSWAQRVVAPHHQKTPFTASGLKRATAIAESFGMSTARSQADAGLRQTATALAEWARSDLARDLVGAGVAAPEAQAFAAATQALAARATRQDHPSQWQFKGKEASELRAATYALQHPATGQGGRLHKPNREHALPPLFEDLAAGGAPASEALRAVIDHVKLTLAEAAPAERQATLTHDAAMHASADMARQQRLRSKEDVVRYFEPILTSMQLRDKVKLSGGGIVGAGLPSLPYSVPSPVVSPVFSAGWSRKEEAFFQAFMPILGMELSLGDARTTGPEVTVGVAAGPDLPGVVKAQVSATEKMSRLHQHSEGTILRLFRQRGRDDELRQEMLGVLDTWVRWDQVHPPGGPAYAGPLEAVLDRHPKVSLGEIQGESLTRSFVSKVSAGANLKLPGADGEIYRVGVNAGASLKAERIAESRVEQGGHIRVTADKGDTAQQKLSVGVQVNTLTPANASEVKLGPDGGDGAIAGGGLPSLIDASRDLFWNLEKHAVSPFTIGGKQDADLDRHYSTPADMLAEIRQHREDWLARCVETLAPDASGEKNTPANRDRAEALLRNFEARVAELGRDSRLCQYNVNFSMRPQASAWIDTFRALEGLARLRGDTQGAEEARANTDRTMQQDATWRPLMLIVREKGRDQRTHGWNFGVRLQRSVGVEGQRTAAQFPPP